MAIACSSVSGSVKLAHQPVLPNRNRPRAFSAGGGGGSSGGFGGCAGRLKSSRGLPALVARASAVDSSGTFARRIEKAWLISQQPKPVVCSSCGSNGYIECKWCGGTGFFILGENMLCEVPSRNTSCHICTGKGSGCCPDCKGTGFRAKWLEEPPLASTQ